MEDAVAAGEYSIAEDGAEFSAAGGNGSFSGADSDVGAVVAEVGEDGPGADVDSCAEDGVADVVEMGRGGSGEEDYGTRLRFEVDARF